MLKFYTGVMVLLLAIIIYCFSAVKKKETDLRRPLRILLLYGIITVLSNLLFAVAWTEYVAIAGFSMFSASIDWLLIALLRYIGLYAGHGLIKHKMRYLYRTLALADTISFVLNPRFKHIFELTTKELPTGDVVYSAVNTGVFYTIHLVICYLFVIRIFYMLIRATMLSSSYYRRKYSGILGIFGMVVVMDAVSVTLHFSLNLAVLFYGFMVVGVYYYSMAYMPKHLLQQMQGLMMARLDNGVICFDEEGKCIYYNDRIWKLVNHAPNKALAEEQYAETRKTMDITDREYHTWEEVHVINGETKYYELSSQCIHDEAGRFVGCYYVITDRTEAKKMFDEQIDAEKRSNHAKSVFLSQVSHEIRTPVNAIYGMNEMIMRECEDEAVRHYATQIKVATDGLIGIINDILDFSKIEAGRMEIVNREYRLDVSLRNVCNMIKIKAEEKGLEFRIEVSDNIPSVLYGDDVRLGQILMNLLSNAVKYTQKGSVTLRVSWIEDEDSLRFEVTDTGMGIKKEDIPQLFTAFARMDEKKNHNIQGTGLGLTITQQLLNMMDSELKVESEYGIGSTFYCSVPQRVVDETPMVFDMDSMGAMSTDYVPSFTAPDARVLVVDDNQINRMVFRNLLKKTQVQIAEAADGYECLQMVKKERYDIIFMDHMMPEMDGIETFKAMQKGSHLNQGVPIVMLTANAIEGAMQEYLDMGFADFLSKPIDPDKLEKMVYKFLNAAAQ